MGHRCTQTGVEPAEQQGSTQRRQTLPQLAGRFLGSDVQRFAGVDRTGVEPLVDRHEAHARGAVSGQDRSFDGRRAPPSRQQGEVDVDEVEAVEHISFDDAPIGDHDPELGPDGERFFRSLADGQPEIQGDRLDRARLRGLSPPAPLVGSGYHDGHIVAGVDDGPQNDRRRIRRAEKGEAQT